MGHFWRPKSTNFPNMGPRMCTCAGLPGVDTVVITPERIGPNHDLWPPGSASRNNRPPGSRKLCSKMGEFISKICILEGNALVLGLEMGPKLTPKGPKMGPKWGRVKWGLACIQCFDPVSLNPCFRGYFRGPGPRRPVQTGTLTSMALQQAESRPKGFTGRRESGGPYRLRDQNGGV